MGIYISAIGFGYLVLQLFGRSYGSQTLSLIGIIACLIKLSFDENTEYVLSSAKSVEQMEKSTGQGLKWKTIARRN